MADLQQQHLHQSEQQNMTQRISTTASARQDQEVISVISWT